MRRVVDECDGPRNKYDGAYHECDIAMPADSMTGGNHGADNNNMDYTGNNPDYTGNNPDYTGSNPDCAGNNLHYAGDRVDDKNSDTGAYALKTGETAPTTSATTPTARGTVIFKTGETAPVTRPTTSRARQQHRGQGLRKIDGNAASTWPTDVGIDDKDDSVMTSWNCLADAAGLLCLRIARTRSREIVSGRDAATRRGGSTCDMSSNKDRLRFTTAA